MQHVATVLGRALHTLSQRLNEELVLLPSATHPGTLFCAVSTREIRERNLERWRAGQRRYRNRRQFNPVVIDFRRAA